MNRARLWLQITIRSYQGSLNPKAIEKACPLAAIVQDVKYWENSLYLMDDVCHRFSILGEEERDVARAKYQWCLDNLEPDSYAFIHCDVSSGIIRIDPQENSRLVGVVFQNSNDATMFKLSFDEA